MTIDQNMDNFTVNPEETGLRLDRLLTTHYPHHSRSYFQYLIDEGCILVNGSICKKKTKPQCDDEIEICFQLTPEISLEPQNIPLDILYEDEHILAINKSVGMVVHPACGHPSGTFVNALLYHCKNIDITDSLRPGIVHRLDKDTSGVLLAAKTQLAHQKLVQAFAMRTMEKHYLAISIGTPKEGLINAPLARHPIHRKERAVCFQKGKPAMTYCEVLASDGELSLLTLKLITGRTHQIRVHLKFLGTPILGDSVYGSCSSNKKFKADRQLLHAHRLQFCHPITNQPIHLEAPMPKDFLKFAQKIS